VIKKRGGSNVRVAPAGAKDVQLDLDAEIVEL